MLNRKIYIYNGSSRCCGKKLNIFSGIQNKIADSNRIFHNQFEYAFFLHQSYIFCVTLINCAKKWVYTGVHDINQFISNVRIVDFP